MKANNLFNVLSRIPRLRDDEIEVIEKIEGYGKGTATDHSKLVPIERNLCKKLVSLLKASKRAYQAASRADQTYAIKKLQYDFQMEVLPAVDKRFDLGELEDFINSRLIPSYEFDTKVNSACVTCGQSAN